MKRLCIFLSLLFVIFACTSQTEQERDPSLLTLERIYSSSEFRSERFGPARWLKNKGAYTTLERSKSNKDGRDVVMYDAETGEARILVPASRLVPKGEKKPLSISDYDWSSDGNKLLIFTNTKRVWRRNTRGNYWVLDMSDWNLHKLGGDAEPSTLMFAKFSPDGSYVGYVINNNIYVENLGTRRITQLTQDGSKTIINGTFDWVHEEEFDLRDGWRWSPDGKSIAYWQLDAEGIKTFYMINNTDSLYPELIPVQYPKAGETNSSSRIGVVNAGGGETRWFELEGDPRNHYLARMDWAANSEEIIFQRMNRLQNTIWLMVGDIRNGKTRTILTERDDTWVDVIDDFHWLDNGKSFIWVSERDGWRHVYSVSRDGREAARQTLFGEHVTDCLSCSGA